MQSDLVAKYLADARNGGSSVYAVSMAAKPGYAAKQDHVGALINPRSQSAPRRAASDHLPLPPNRAPWPAQRESPKGASTPKKESRPVPFSPRTPPLPSPAPLPRQNKGSGSAASSHASWWLPPGQTGVPSDVTFPTTAVTTRAGPSISSTEFRYWFDRMEKLEKAVKEERKKRKQFEEELKRMQVTE